MSPPQLVPPPPPDVLPRNKQGAPLVYLQLDMLFRGFEAVWCVVWALHAPSVLIVVGVLTC